MTIRIALVIILVAFSGYFFGARASTVAFAADSIAQRSKNSNGHGFQRNVRFSGEVLKGRSFERQVGANLFFRLVPDELGWSISMGSKAAWKNFCSVVTPPYRGMNALRIEGWHFRNSDNSGPNEPGPKNVNAPQELREFYFVLNEADYRSAFDALQILLWPYSYSKQQIDAAEGAHAKVRKGRGKLIIRDLKLNVLELGKQAGIERMTFDVELSFP
ncbi:MAG TPA: hypothetical protein VK603_07800 [Candidatus Saccharimonadales bacterium]|nr:hypothetical protein [Candidatus Saccharimonadales bacterium]